MGYGAAIAGLAAAGASAYGASQTGGVGKTQNPADSSREWLDAYVRQGPGALGLEQLLRPAYGALDRQLAYQTLFGTGAQKGFRQVLRMDDNNRWYVAKVPVNLPATPGMIGMAQQAQGPLEDIYSGATTRGLGAGQQAAWWLDPEGQMLNQGLAADANQGLALGSALDPATRRELQQGVRAAQAARGMGYGLGDAAEEGMTLGSAAEARRRQRQQYALAVNAGRPNMMAYADRYAPAAGLGLGLVGSAYGLGGAAGPKIGIDPFRQPGVQNANNAVSNTLAAASGGLMGLSGQLLAQHLRNQANERARINNMSDDEYYFTGGSQGWD
jgi:hypothetical protein